MVRAVLTNPLEQDPVLKELLSKLDLIETRRGFARWKQHFLQQFESHLEGESIQKAGQKYHAFARRLDRLVLLLKALERLMSAGDLSRNKITVKSRQSLGELQKQLTGMIQHTQALVPGTLDHETKAGYTKFDMGAVLVRDGFVEYDRLCLCRDVLWHMRDSLLHEVADRQLLEEMERYELHIEAFCGIMGTDLGLHGAMLKCRDILRSKDEDFYKYEQSTKEKRKQRQQREQQQQQSSSRGGTESHPSAGEYTTSEYDEEEWDEDEEESDEEEESDSEEESDEDDEEEEEEGDDDDSSDWSDVVSLCGMEIPLRLTKHKSGSDSYVFYAEDDISEISYDDDWEWTLQVPSPPKRMEKKKMTSAQGLPSAPALDDDDDEDNDGGEAAVDHDPHHDEDNDDNAEQETYDDGLEEEGMSKMETDTFDEDSILQHDSVINPPNRAPHYSSHSNTTSTETEEEPTRHTVSIASTTEEEEDDDGRSSLWDSRHASTVSSLTQPTIHSPPHTPRKARAKSEPIQVSSLPSSPGNSFSQSPAVTPPRPQRRASSTYIPSPSKQHPVERVQMPPRSPPPKVPDNKPTERLKYSHMNDYYHGGSSADWKKATLEAKQVQKQHNKIDAPPSLEPPPNLSNTNSNQNENDDTAPLSPPQQQRLVAPSVDGSTSSASPTKRIVKARLRKKTAGSGDSSDEISNDGTNSKNSLDINDKRVIIRRRGGKKKTATASSNDSVSSHNTTSDDTSGRQQQQRSTSSYDSGSEASSSAGSKSSELDNVRHARRKEKTKKKRRPSLRRSGSSRSNSSRKSTELKRMAARARRRSDQDGDDASSLGSRKSVGSQQSRRSQSGKKDPLHNLLFQNKTSGSSRSISAGDLSAADHKNSPAGRKKLAASASDLDSIDSTPTRSIKPSQIHKDTNSNYKVQDDQRERTKLCYKWYGRLGHPSRDTFKRRVRGDALSSSSSPNKTNNNTTTSNGGGSMTFDGLTEDDVDLLPWIHGGARINATEMTKLLTGNKAAKTTTSAKHDDNDEDDPL